MAEDKKDEKAKKAPAKKTPAKKTAAKKPAAKKAAPKKDAAAKKPAAKKTAAKKAPAKKAESKKETKPVPASDTIKQTLDEQAEALKGHKSGKASTRSTDAAAQSKKDRARRVRKIPQGDTITVTQIGSPVGRQAKQRATLVGLGLNKMHRTRTLEDTPAIRGMIRKVRHLVKVVDAA